MSALEGPLCQEDDLTELVSMGTKTNLPLNATARSWISDNAKVLESSVKFSGEVSLVEENRVKRFPYVFVMQHGAISIPDKDGERHVIECNEVGTFQAPNSHVHVIVYSLLAWSLARAALWFLIVMLLAVLTIFFAGQFKTMALENNNSQPFEWRAARQIFFNYSFPFLVLTVYFGVLGLALFLVRKARLALTQDHVVSNTRGYPVRYQTQLRVGYAIFCVVGVGCSIVSWTLLLHTNDDITHVMDVATKGVWDTITEAKYVLSTLNYTVAQAQAVLDFQPPPVAYTVLNETQNTISLLEASTQRITSMSSNALFLIAAAGFMSAQGVLFACVSGMAACARRSVKLMRIGTRLAFFMFVCLLLDVSIRAFLYGVASEVHSKGNEIFRNGLLNTTEFGIPEDSPVAVLVYQCVGTSDSDISLKGAKYLQTMIDRVLADKLNPILVKNNITPISLGLSPNQTLSLTLLVTKYAPFLSSQLVGIKKLLKSKDANATLKELAPELDAKILPMADAAVSSLQGLFSLLQCTHLRNYLERAVENLEKDGTLTGQEVGIRCQIAISVILLMMALLGGLAVHVLSHPEKDYYEKSTNRWFIFYPCYCAHKRLVEKHQDDHEWFSKKPIFCKSQWSANEFLGQVEIVCLGMTLIALVQCIFLLLDPGNEFLLPAIISLLVGCVFGIIPATVILDKEVRRILYAVSFTLEMCAAGVCVAALHNERMAMYSCDNVIDCMKNVERVVYLWCVVSVTFLSALSTAVVGYFVPQKPPDPEHVLRISSLVRKYSCLKRFLKHYILRFKKRRMAALLLGIVVAASLAFLLQKRLSIHTLNSKDKRLSNGCGTLCGIPLHQAMLPCSHNTMSSSEDDFVLPNNFLGVKKALEAGIRVLMIDTHPNNGSVYLCHGPCALGGYPLIRDLIYIRDFLAANPAEVVIILFEQYVNTEQVVVVFEEAGLGPYLYNTTSSPISTNGTFRWPTFAELGASGARLLVFTDVKPGRSLNARPPNWMLYMWDYMLETDYAMATVQDLSSCEIKRGRMSDNYTGSGRLYHDNMMMIHNVFLTAPVGTPGLADMVNHEPILSNVVERCRTQFFGGRPGLMVAVDFWSIGDVIKMMSSQGN